MKKTKKYISLSIVAIFICFAAATVSAAEPSEFNIQTNKNLYSLGNKQSTPISFTVMFRAGLIAGKPNGPAGKKAKDERPNKKEVSSPSSAENSSALSSKPQASSESSSFTSSSVTSSAPVAAVSSNSSPSLLIPTIICFVIGIAFAAVAIVMRKKNKSAARLLDETSEIEISDELKHPSDKK